jgi:small-conductance mechanosensitive channel
MLTEKVKVRSSRRELLPRTLEQLNAIAYQVQEQYCSSWEKTHKAKLKRFIEIHETWVKNLQRLVKSDFQTDAFAG